MAQDENSSTKAAFDRIATNMHMLSLVNGLVPLMANMPIGELKSMIRRVENEVKIARNECDIRCAGYSRK